MKKNDFIYTGSALYRISKIENNLVKVVPTSRKMTCSLASRTYHQSQLEDLGYRTHKELSSAKTNRKMVLSPRCSRNSRIL